MDLNLLMDLIQMEWVKKLRAKLIIITVIGMSVVIKYLNQFRNMEYLALGNYYRTLLRKRGLKIF